MFRIPKSSVYYLFIALLLSTVFIVFLLSGREDKSNEGGKEGEDRDSKLQGTLYSQIDAVILSLRTVFGHSVISSDEVFKRELDNAVAQLRIEIDGETDPQKKVNGISSFIFGVWNLKFDMHQDDLSNLLPDRVLKTRSGSCLGLSIIYLLLGEQLDMPLYGVIYRVIFL